VVGRPDLAERGRRGPDGIRSQTADVDALGDQELTHELTVPLGPHTREDRRSHAETGEAGGEVAGEASDEARVGTDVLQRRAQLVRVEIDSDPTHDEGLDHR
jgi:hypothetical protein